MWTLKTCANCYLQFFIIIKRHPIFATLAVLHNLKNKGKKQFSHENTFKKKKFT